MASKKWTTLEMFFINCAKFDMKHLKFSKQFSIKLLKTTVLRNRTEEAISKKLR